MLAASKLNLCLVACCTWLITVRCTEDVTLSFISNVGQGRKLRFAFDSSHVVLLGPSVFAGLMQDAQSVYTKSHPFVQAQYSPSSTAKAALQANSIDFALQDVLVSATDLSVTPDLVALPVGAMAVVPVFLITGAQTKRSIALPLSNNSRCSAGYNVQLTFTYDLLADIFLCTRAASRALA